MWYPAVQFILYEEEFWLMLKKNFVVPQRAHTEIWIERIKKPILCVFEGQRLRLQNLEGVLRPFLALDYSTVPYELFMALIIWYDHKFIAFFPAFRINVFANNLYPPVECPAPVGTPLISPHVLWDHSQTWDVPKAEDFPTSTGGSGAATVYNIGVSWSFHAFLSHKQISEMYILSLFLERKHESVYTLCCSRQRVKLTGQRKTAACFDRFAALKPIWAEG